MTTDPEALFYDVVLAAGSVWTVGDDAGVPTAETVDGRPAMPFWSSPSRVARVRRTVPAYGRLQPVQVPLDAWRERWLPGLVRDGLLVGLDWSGQPVTGEGADPADVEAVLEARTAP